MLTVSRIDFWFAVMLIVVALLAHAALPRYEWRGSPPLVRIDRWTGRAEAGRYQNSVWQPTRVTITAYEPADHSR